MPTSQRWDRAEKIRGIRICWSIEQANYIRTLEVNIKKKAFGDHRYIQFILDLKAIRRKKKLIIYKTKHSSFGKFYRLISYDKKYLYESLIMIDSTSMLDNWTRKFHETLQSGMIKNFKKIKMDNIGRFMVY